MESSGSSQSSDLKSESDLSASQGAVDVRRLVATQRYFGLDARTLHVGVKRTLARMSAQSSLQLQVTLQSLREDFRLDREASQNLLRGFLAGGLLHPEGSGYCVTERFRECALACLAVPLSRARAKTLIDKACATAARMNADWARSPFLVEMLAVSGSYMSRRNPLPELSLWLVLGRRRQPPARHGGRPVDTADATRQALDVLNGISSFVVARVVPDRHSVQRPFIVVFQADEDAIESPVPVLERLRDWSASISRRLDYAGHRHSR